ncbi:MAG TPA: glycine cleavage system aminomethyltransferase GcvT, partial [Polyangiales bacterium]|nr:glycine cleavage system aminomethyltransferase GcvT [Polyangiales bacterium]
FDVSHMGELHVQGPGALAAIDALITNDLSKAEDGQAVYTCCCNEAGTVLDDLIVYRRSARDVLVVCNASNRPKISAHFAQALAGRADFRDESDETALIAVQGPRALELVALCKPSIDASQLRSFRFANGTLSGVEVTIARTGYTGEDGVELFVANDGAVKLWSSLLEAGHALGAEPIGLGARDTLRLEARLSLYGNEIDETTNPLEAGLGWVVKLDKGEWLGRDALRAVKAAPLPRKLVGFEMTGRGIARHGYPITNASGSAVGIVTSGAPSLSTGKNIGLGYVPSDLAAIDTPIGVEIRGKVVEAKICATPFYKPTRVNG